MTNNVIYGENVIYGLACPGPRGAIARSGVQHKASRAAAQYILLKNRIPDLRGGFAAACPGHEAADVIYDAGPSGARPAQTASSMREHVTYARTRHLCGTASPMRGKRSLNRA